MCLSLFYFYFSGKVIELVHHTLNRTSAKLSEWFEIPSLEHRPIVHRLFGDIEGLMSVQDLLIENSVTVFFDDIFPVIFKTVNYGDVSDTWTHHHSHCLSKHLGEIQPRPFGKYPEKIARNLHYGLPLSYNYIHALHVILETLNTTENVVLDDECQQAMTRLQFCSHCQGIVHKKPCNGFCLNVMRGCLVGVAEMGENWNDLITGIETLVRDMSEKRIDDVLTKLSLDLTDAIFNAVMEAETDELRKNVSRSFITVLLERVSRLN